MHTRSRLSVLFFSGCLLSVTIHMLHMERHVLESTARNAIPQPHVTVLDTPWWVPVTSGLSSIVIGELFLAVDRATGAQSQMIAWPTVFRANIGFLGIAYASAKFTFTNKVEMAIALWISALWLWWLTDRTRVGLLLSIVLSSLGTLAVQCLSFYDIYRHTDPDFYYVRSWIPALLLAAVIAFGSLGRQLASHKKTCTE